MKQTEKSTSFQLLVNNSYKSLSNHCGKIHFLTNLGLPVSIDSLPTCIMFHVLFLDVFNININLFIGIQISSISNHQGVIRPWIFRESSDCSAASAYNFVILEAKCENIYLKFTSFATNPLSLVLGRSCSI